MSEHYYSAIALMRDQSSFQPDTARTHFAPYSISYLLLKLVNNMGDRSKYEGRKGKRGGKKAPISRKRPANRYEMEAFDPAESVGTSARKLNLSHDARDVEVDASFGYRFINFATVFSIISTIVKCKECDSDVTFTESGIRGLGFKIVVSCKKCAKTEIPNSPLINSKAYDINRRIIIAMRLLGIGLHGIKKFCAFMELPRPVFHSFYDRVVKMICDATERVCKASMENAVKIEKEENARKGLSSELIVSGDGSWRKRGFSSLFGLVSLIGWNTGKVVDIMIKSKYCKACEFWNKKMDTAEYDEWLENHKDECQINHTGSAGKMEVDAVIDMFQRSESLYKVKYGSYIGDGDSKTFTGLLKAEPYQNFAIKKKECIDHVQKRMGTRLRNLKKNVRGLGGAGKLTNKLIDELSIYYGLAIRRNYDSVEKMKNEIWATLHHKLSTDENPQHSKCPTGDNSWCSWQKARATNTLSSFIHKPALPEAIFKAIEPIYKELSSEDLLTRCLGGFTQNSNESLNATVWSMAPKSTSSGKTILDIAGNLAVCTFNDGISSVMQVVKQLDMIVGRNCYNFCVEADELRVDFSNRSLSEAAKTARIASKSTRKEEEELNVDIEGQLYGAGIAD